MKTRLGICLALAISLTLLFSACGGSQPATSVSMTQSGTSTTISSGSSPVTLTATVTNDKTNGGVTWSLSPASGCGTLSGSGATASYTPPAEASLAANCTATITATSVADGTKTASTALSIKALAITVPGTQTTAVNEGSSSSIALSPALANDASGSATLSWSIPTAGAQAVGSHASLQHVALSSARLSPRAVVNSSCGSLASDTGNSNTYTPPTSGGACVATIEVCAVVSNVTTNICKTFTVDVNATLAISTSSLTSGSYGTGYAPVQLAVAQGSGVGPYTWTATGLPNGITVSPAGILSGTPTAAGNYNVSVTAKDTDAFSVTQSIPLTVSKATATVTPTAASKTYGASDPTLTGTLTGFLAADNVTASYSRTAGEAAGGSYTISATLSPTAALSNYTVTYNTANFTINKATPTISTLPSAGAITYGQTLAASALTGGAASNAGNPVAGSFAFTTPTTAPGAGTANQSVTFTPTDTTDYSTVTGSVSVTVNKATPTVSTWPTATAISYGQTLASSTLTGGTTSTPGNFSFTTPTTAPGVGTASQSVTFTPTDAMDYSTVTGSVSVTVNKATPTISTSPTATAITYGQTLANSTLTGGAAAIGSNPVAGSFAFTTPTTAPGAGTANQSVTFTPSDTTDYNTVTGSVSVTVNKATPTVSTWPAATAISYGQTLASSTLSGGSATPPGTFAFTTPGTVPNAGTASQSVTFTPTDTTDYSTVSGSVNVTVNKATPTFSGLTSPSIVVGQGPTVFSGKISAGTVAPAGEQVTVTINSQPYLSNAIGSDGSFSVSVPTASLAAGTYPVTYNYNGDTNFSAASNNGTMLTVNQAIGVTLTSPSSGYLATSVSGAASTTTVTPTVLNVPTGGNTTLNVALSGTGTCSNGYGTLSSTTNVPTGTQLTYTAPTSPCNVTITATSNQDSTKTNTLSITVYTALSLPSPNPSSLGTATVGANYTGSITATGGIGPYAWTVTGLPSNGLNSNASGNTGTTLTISGTATASTTVNFSVSVKDNTTGATFGPIPYSVTINPQVPLTLPIGGSSALPAAMVGQPYSSNYINATGGVPGYTYTVGLTSPPTTTVPSNGSLITLSNGLSASIASGSNALTISGTPGNTTAVSFYVSVKDSSSPTNTNGPVGYTINVNPAGAAVSGQIMMPNYCNSSLPVTFTVTLTNTSTNATLTAQTDSNGNYSFSSVPFATYNITASAPGAASQLYYPPSYQNVTLSTSNSSVTGENFNATVGYNVSGTVSYSGAQTGQTYLTLQSNNCGGGNGGPGTSITETALTSGGGAYTIHGVPPGSYTLSAWMDSTGIPSGTAGYPGPQGALNVNDPTGTASSSVTVANANVTGADVTLTNATYSTPSGNPGIQVIPATSGVLIFYNPPTVSSSSGNKEEDANEYLVEWAAVTGTDSLGNPYCALGGGTGGGQFKTVAGSHTFYATGANGATVWMLNNNSMGAGSFSPNTGYCFQARSFNSLASNQHPSGWTNFNTDSLGNPQPVLASVSSVCSSNCTTVSGTVTIPSGVTIAPGAPLYVGFYQQNNNSNGPSAIYATEIASPVSGANSYSITVPSGSGYYMFGILDQNNDGQIDAGDASDTNSNNTNPLTFSGSTQPGVNKTLPGTSSTAGVQTSYQSCGSNCSGYNLYLEVDAANKLPVGVTLYSGPNFLNAIDIGVDSSSGNTGRFDINAGTLGAIPNVGDTYKFTVTYSDGSVDQGSAGTIKGQVTGWNGGSTVVGPNNAPSNLQVTGSDQPTFSWTDPSSSQGSNFYYSFYLSQGTNCSGNCNIWQVPGQNSNLNGFSSSITSLVWGVDPTNSSNTPSVTSLTSLYQYYWGIQVSDSNNNKAQASTSFTAP